MGFPKEETKLRHSEDAGGEKFGKKKKLKRKQMDSLTVFIVLIGKKHSSSLGTLFY